ncbi:MAG: hypothetical protein U0S36_13870 [Candidatus Nanopelagicales bacterium]
MQILGVGRAEAHDGGVEQRVGQVVGVDARGEGGVLGLEGRDQRARRGRLALAGRGGVALELGVDLGRVGRAERDEALQEGPAQIRVDRQALGAVPRSSQPRSTAVCSSVREVAANARANASCRSLSRLDVLEQAQEQRRPAVAVAVAPARCGELLDRSLGLAQQRGDDRDVALGAQA